MSNIKTKKSFPPYMLIFLNKEQIRTINRTNIHEINCYKLDEKILCKQQITM